MRHFCIYITAFTSILVTCTKLKAQDIRDSIAGKYLVQKQADGAGALGKDTLIITKDLTDTNRIYLYYVFDGGGIYMIFKRQDTTFYDKWNPTSEYGRFYPNDSIYVYRWLYNSMKPYYFEYWGHRIKKTTGIHEFGATKIDFEIYPNPVNVKLNLFFNIQQFVKKFELYSINGMLLETVEKNSLIQQLSIDVSKYTEGLYFVKVNTADGYAVKKIIVQR